MEVRRIKLPLKVKAPVLALGSQTKNTLCFVKDDISYLSPLHPDLLPMIQYIRNKNITVFLITNGRRFANYQFLKQVVDAGIDYISTSVPIYDEKSALAVSGTEQAYKDLIKGLQNAKKFEKKIDVCLHVVVDNNNIDYYKRLFDLIYPTD